MASGRKLIGSAQFREAGAVLQHGSLLLDGDQAEVHRLLREPGAADPTGPATLAMLCDPLPSWKQLTESLAAGCEETLGVILCPSELSAGEQLRASQLAEHYASPAWTWRD